MSTSGARRLWLILLLAVLVTLVYLPSAAVLFQQWGNFVNLTFTHGWLILAMSVALVLQVRQELARAPAAPLPAAQLALLAASFVWLVCYRASIQDLHITVFPALFWLAVTAAFGLRVGRLMLFPVVFFYFAVPSWSQLADPLQHLTVAVMRASLAITGPPAVIEGAVVRIPNGSFVVEEGCSGLHFMIVGLAVAALHGQLRHDPWRTRVAQLALMAALALLANWVRVYTVIEAGYLTDMHHYLVSVSHYWFGWGVFALALFAFFWLSTWFPHPELLHTSDELPAPVAPGSRSEILGVAVAALLLVVLPGLSGALRRSQPLPTIEVSTLIHPQSPWSYALGSYDSFWMPVFRGSDQSMHTVLESRSGTKVEVFAVGYREQRQGAELVGSSSTLFGPHLKAGARQPVDSGSGRFMESEVRDPLGTRSLIWSRYEIERHPFLTGLPSQLWYGTRATTGHPSAALVAARVDCAPDCRTARDTLRALADSGSLR
jgi:exosortase